MKEEPKKGNTTGNYLRRVGDLVPIELLVSEPEESVKIDKSIAYRISLGK